MEFLVPNGLSPIQNHVCRLKANLLTYKEIMNQVKELQFTSNLVSCILRSAKGLFWEPQQHGGNDPYLSEYDEQVLVEMILHSEEEYNPIGVLEVVDEAFKLKKDDMRMGAVFSLWLIQKICP